MPVRKRGEVYHYEFMLKGTRYYGTLPTARTKAEARDQESEKRQQVRDGTYGREPGTEDFATFVERVYMQYAKSHKQSWRHDEFRSDTLKEYFKDKRFDDITPMLVEKYIKDRLNTVTMRKRTRSTATVHKEVMLLSAIFNMAIEERVTESNPCRYVRKATRKKLKSRNRRERYLTVEEEKRLMLQLTGRREHIRPIVQLAIHTGMRQGELLKLKREHVNLGALPLYFTIDENRIGVRPNEALVVMSKNGRPRTVPLNPVAQNILKSLIGDTTAGEYVFRSTRTGLYPTEIKRAFKSACLDAKIPHGVSTPNGLVFHDLRHTWATRAAEAGVDPFTIRDVLGHSTVKMSSDYTHSTPESRQRAAEAVAAYSRRNYGRITASAN